MKIYSEFSTYIILKTAPLIIHVGQILSESFLIKMIVEQVSTLLRLLHNEELHGEHADCSTAKHTLPVSQERKQK